MLSGEVKKYCGKIRGNFTAKKGTVMAHFTSGFEKVAISLRKGLGAMVERAARKARKYDFIDEQIRGIARGVEGVVDNLPGGKKLLNSSWRGAVDAFKSGKIQKLEKIIGPSSLKKLKKMKGFRPELTFEGRIAKIEGDRLSEWAKRAPKDANLATKAIVEDLKSKNPLFRAIQVPKKRIKR